MREQIKIYSKERDGKVICVCLASNKLCNRQCDTEMASLDEYEKISCLLYTSPSPRDS